MRIRKMREAIALMLLTFLVALFTTPAASAAADNLELQGSLEKLTTELEKRRVAFRMPGMVIAVVKDDQIELYLLVDLALRTSTRKHLCVAISYFVAKFRVNSQLSMAICELLAMACFRHCVRIV